MVTEVYRSLPTDLFGGTSGMAVLGGFPVLLYGSSRWGGSVATDRYVQITEVVPESEH